MSEIRDYNGQGRWSSESIQRRFASYAKSFGTAVVTLEPRAYEKGAVIWIYPLLESVIDGIIQADRACIELGVELIEDSSSMPFGMILKSNTAKALRRSSEFLSEDQRTRIRRRVADMLIGQYMPREFIQYVKLAHSIGFNHEVARVEAEADLTHYWVSHYLVKLTAA